LADEMNRRGIALAVLWNCLLPLSAQIVDDAFQKQQSRVADAVEKFPASKVRVFIYSLHPEWLHRDFYGYLILRSAEITAPQEKEELLNPELTFKRRCRRGTVKSNARGCTIANANRARAGLGANRKKA